MPRRTVYHPVHDPDGVRLVEGERPELPKFTPGCCQDCGVKISSRAMAQASEAGRVLFRDRRSGRPVFSGRCQECGALVLLSKTESGMMVGYRSKDFLRSLQAEARRHEEALVLQHYDRIDGKRPPR